MMQFELRIRNLDLADVLQGYTDRKLRFALSRFGDRVGRVVVTLSDFTTLDRGIVKSCQISAELMSFRQVTVRETDPDLYTAIDRAAGRVGRLFAVRLGLQRDGVSRPVISIVRARGARRENTLASKRPERLPRKRLPTKAHGSAGETDQNVYGFSNSPATKRRTRGGNDASRTESLQYRSG